MADACDQGLLRDFKKRLWKASLLLIQDTKDVSVLEARYATDMRRDYVWGTYWSIVTRLYNLESTWDAFEQAKVDPVGAKEPHWQALRRVLARLYRGMVQKNPSKQHKVHGGLYRHPKLTAFRASPKAKWQKINLKKTSPAARDALNLQLLWKALPKEKLRAYQKKPSRGTFGAWFDAFKEATDSTMKGLGDYMLKVSLDPLVATGVFEDSTLSRWPEKCDGYQKYLSLLYGAVAKRHTLGCLYHLHHSVAHEHGFKLSDTAAQLCWAKRRDQNALRD